MDTMNRPELILIVDDDAVSRAMLKRIFASEYAVVEAKDGVEALRLLREQPGIIGVILDLCMPLMDGFGVMAGMQGNPALSCLPVIVVTASDDTDTQNRALNYGAVDVIVKPIDPVEIRLRLRRLLALLRASKLEAENKWLKERVRLSEIDGKTGLWNKQTFCAETRKLLDADPSGRYAVLRWDIDNFKVFNDFFGTSAGDALLRKIGEQCRSNTGAHAAPCTQGHYDSDHFVSLWRMEELNPEQVHRSILTMLHGAFPDYAFSVHLGIYAFDGQTMDVGIMCDRALLALRSVKNSYDVHYAWYCEAMRTEVLEEQSIVSVMKDALRSGQFVPFLQPQYNYATGELIGAEALVRWRHPEKGLIPPEKYIPLFEKNGFIYELDHHIWEQVCALLKSWRDKGLTIPCVSVNISRRDLYHPGLVEEFSSLIQAYGLDASMLHLEITESAYVDNPELVLSFVSQLQRAGFKVEMDDFGSGYSSLNTLKDVHVDLLKLDMAFITPNTDRGRGGSILTSVVGMAHAIHLPVIAEGVETRQQADYLKSIGCFYMQGYYFAKPMPAEDFEALLRTRKSVVGQDPRFRPGFDSSVDFLDATTQSTLLFNSFVGGAAILEYRGGNVAALRLNDRYYEELEISAAEYAKKQYHLAETIDPAYRQGFLAMLEQAIRTEKDASCEVRTIALRDDAQPLYVRCGVRLLANKVDSHVFYMTVENITARVLSRQQNEMYHNIISNLPMGVAVYALEDRLHLLYCNDLTGQMLGLTRAEYEDRLLTYQAEDFLSGSDTLPTDIRQRLLRGEVLSFRFHTRRQDGSFLWLRVGLRLAARENAAPLLYASFVDVTDVAETEAKLSARQRTLSALIDTVPGGIFRYSADTDEFAFVSEPMLRKLGYTREQFAEKFHNRFTQMVYREDRARALAKIESDIARTGSTDSCEYRIEAADGTLLWVHDAGRLIVDENGDRWYIVVIVDIIERKRLELALESVRERNEALLENTPNGIACFRYENGVKHIDYLNSSLLRMLGYTRSELTGDNAPDDAALIHPEDLQSMLDARDLTIRTGARLQQSCRLLRRSGGYLWVNVDGNFLFQSPGTGMLHISFSDITQMKLLQEQQRQDREQLELLLDAIPGGLGTYELHPDHFRIIYISPGVPAISGRTIEEYLTLFNERQQSDIYPPDEPMLREHLKKAMSTGEDIDIIYRVLHVSGQTVWVDMHGTIRGTRNGYPVFHAVFHNPSQTTALYRAIIDETDSALTVTDFHTKEQLFANRAAEELCRTGGLWAKPATSICWGAARPARTAWRILWAAPPSAGRPSSTAAAISAA